MLNGLKFDFNALGLFVWFIFLGLLIIIFSIIHNPDYVFLGSCLSLYGMIGFFIDLLIDRLLSHKINEQLNKDNVHKTPYFSHFVRFLLQMILILILIYLVNLEYNFI